MLILTRKPQEFIDLTIPGRERPLVVGVLRVDGSKVRLMIEADPDITVHRREITERIAKTQSRRRRRRCRCHRNKAEHAADALKAQADLAMEIATGLEREIDRCREVLAEILSQDPPRRSETAGELSRLTHALKPKLEVFTHRLEMVTKIARGDQR
jgi:carbon storage regulator CsrA